MAIVISPLKQNFKIEITEGEEKLVFSFNQLDYKTKSLIASLTSSVVSGKYISDSTMQIFYNVQYGLKDVEGLTDHEGNPYKLRFETNKKQKLEESCVDELLATPFSDKLQYTAHKLSLAILPSEIKHPITNQKIEGVEFIVTSGIKKKQ